MEKSLLLDTRRAVLPFFLRSLDQGRERRREEIHATKEKEQEQRTHAIYSFIGRALVFFEKEKRRRRGIKDGVRNDGRRRGPSGE